MTTQVLRGKIEPLALVDVLAYLGRNRETGVLHVSREHVKKSIFVSDGYIIFARSNKVEDRLGDLLMARGQITQEQYDEGSRVLKEKGVRHGRALVEIGAITPKILWEAIQAQVQNIAWSVIPWESGEFEFIKQDLKKKETITLKLSIMDVVLDVIRNLDNTDLFKSRFHDMGHTLSLNADSDFIGKLAPHETYVLDFINDESTLAQICAKSDYGEAETLRVLYLLRVLGLISSDAAPLGEEVHPLIEKYNRLFRFLGSYLSERVGGMGVNLLAKYFEEARQAHPLIFESARVLGDGSLSANLIQRNIEKMALEPDSRSLALDDAMNEYLNLGILAVRKVLGAEHEAEAVRQIGGMSS